MDTTSAVMGLGLLFLFVAPIGYLLYDQSSKDKKRAKKLAVLAAQQGLTFTETEHFQDLSLGFDPESHILLIYRARKEQSKTINIEDVKKIELLEVDDDEKRTENLDNVRKICLQIRFSSGGNEQILFYTEEKNAVTQKDLRLQKARKWQTILARNIKK